MAQTRKRPCQHKRHTPSGKVITVNKGVKAKEKGRHIKSEHYTVRNVTVRNVRPVVLQHGQYDNHGAVDKAAAKADNAIMQRYGLADAHRQNAMPKLARSVGLDPPSEASAVGRSRPSVQI